MQNKTYKKTQYIATFTTQLKEYLFLTHSVYYLSIQFHAVFRTQQGRQKEPRVKTLSSPLSAAFWRHCMLIGGTQRRALPRH